jgi:glycosyltransferase involved in cell wall biosynthesis
MAEPPVTLAVAMIVRNEAAKLAPLLADTAAFRDELVVLDTGSTDDTIAIARAAGAIVYEAPWTDDFAAARNAAFEHCTSEWIMWLDADDRLPKAVQAAISAIKETLTDGIDAVFAEYRLFDPTGEQLLMRYDRERLLRRRAGLRWAGAVHEAIEVPADRSIRVADVWVEHRPLPEADPSDRNLRILRRMLDAGDRSARTLFYYANELRDHGRFAEAATIYTDYLAVTTLPWEAYDARISLSICLAATERADEAYRQALLAIGEDSSRAAGYLRAGVHHYERFDWTQAVPLFLAATAATRPVAGFSAEADYTFLPWDYLGVCYYRLGLQQRARQATERAIELGSPDLDRLRENLRYIDELS